MNEQPRTPSRLYDGYVELEGWTNQPSGYSPEVFENVLEAAGRADIKKVVEIGFGSGAFLDWAKDRGLDVSGVEIQPELIAAAQARGHSVSLPYPDCANVDAIVALDVFEHLEREELVELLDFARRALAPRGLIVARLPNAYSPFSGYYQHGDPTHKSSLGAAAIDQLARPHGFRLVRAVNPRPLPGKFVRRCRRRLSYLFRDLFEIVVGHAYLGGRVPMDANILVILERA